MAQELNTSCKLALADVVPTLAKHKLVLGKAGTVPSGSGVLRTDSRKVEAGDVFLAYRGVASDGHQHLAKAVAQGAAFVVVEDPALVPAGTPWVQVASGRAAWTYLAARAHGDPQDHLTLLGVTGTNGKTSTVWMTGQLLRAAGLRCLTVGTLGAYFDGEHVRTGHTTPDPDLLYALFAEAKKRGITHVAMEVSSHAVVQEKVLPLRFTAAAFTSFSRDHLDFHPTMDDYWAAKWQLFTALSRPNARLAFCDSLARAPKLGSLSGETYVYGLDARARAEEWGAQSYLQIACESSTFKGSSITLHTESGGAVSGCVPYFARHALENFCAAYALASRAVDHLAPATWAKLSPVPGRLEQVTGPKGPGVVVDYAHTPDALEKTLQVLRPLCKGKLRVVFGCGGDRDRGKRPQMGRIAETLADAVYVTSDNPRTEDPGGILADIVAGMQEPARAAVETDRARAIELAIKESAQDDLVLIAGKGHETYQILGDRTIAFDDRQTAAGFLG